MRQLSFKYIPTAVDSDLATRMCIPDFRERLYSDSPIAIETVMRVST